MREDELQRLLERYPVSYFHERLEEVVGRKRRKRIQVETSLEPETEKRANYRRGARRLPHNEPEPEVELVAEPELNPEPELEPEPKRPVVEAPDLANDRLAALVARAGRVRPDRARAKQPRSP